MGLTRVYFFSKLNLRMKLPKLILVLSLAALFLFPLFNIFAQDVTPKDAIKSRIIVKFKDAEAQQSSIRKYSARELAEIPKIDASVLEIDGPPEEALKKLRRERVEYVEVDAVATTLSNDSLYSSQWALPKIKWDQVDSALAQYNPSEAVVTIAVIDTGVDYTHPDLAGKVNTSEDYDFVNNDSNAMDDNLHGTHVAGIAAAATNNNAGVAGVSINSTRILPIKVLNYSGSGYYSWVASGITYAADHGAKVINLSLGGSVRSSTLENAVNYAWNKGVVVVAAAGNSNNTSKTYPGAYSNAMAVWASNETDNKASFSSYGIWVDIGAPGTNILSTVPATLDKDGVSDGYYFANGTSMSTPHVAGLAGLLFSQHPAWSESQVRNQIEDSADSVPDRQYRRGNLGDGRINVFRALTE